MKPVDSLALRYAGQKIQLIDQTWLPNKEKWVAIGSVEEMETAIKLLKVRGAPLIGVSAALFLGWYAEQGVSQEEFLTAAARLRASRPTAVNLMYCIDKLVELATSDFSVSAIVCLAERLFDEDVELCQRIGENGASLIKDGDGILTHCNTGGLATAGRGTALGVIQTAYEQGKKIHVYVDETRPLLQGGRLTTWELEKLGIPYTLICDNMAAPLIRDGKIQLAVVGADRIAKNGDFANKTGTYSVALACHAHNVPFYTAAPFTTIDFNCSDGSQIPIEERVSCEVQGVRGAFGDVVWAPENCRTYNPAFDVTPANITTGWILDNGYLTQDDVKNGKIEQLQKEL